MFLLDVFGVHGVHALQMKIKNINNNIELHLYHLMTNCLSRALQIITYSCIFFCSSFNGTNVNGAKYNLNASVKDCG